MIIKHIRNKDLFLLTVFCHNPVGIKLCAVVFLQTHDVRIIFTLLSFNLKILEIFKISSPFSLLTLALHLKILISVTPINPSVSDRDVTELTKADLFSLRRQLFISYNLLPQALTTRKLASNVVTNVDPAGDSFSTMKVTMSPMVAVRMETTLLWYFQLHMLALHPLFWAQPWPSSLCLPSRLVHVCMNVYLFVSLSQSASYIPR